MIIKKIVVKPPHPRAGAYEVGGLYFPNQPGSGGSVAEVMGVTGELDTFTHSHYPSRSHMSFIMEITFDEATGRYTVHSTTGGRQEFEGQHVTNVQHSDAG